LKYISILLVCVSILTGCKENSGSQSADDKIVIEQYFYSNNEDELKKLANKLRIDGYQINDYKSYEHEGKTEWYFYSSKEVKTAEIDAEDRKSEKYAEEFNVGYDGHGFQID